MRRASSNGAPSSSRPGSRAATLAGTGPPAHERRSGLRLRRDGQILAGRYRIEHIFGEGSVGLVYRALDLRLARPVAIKLLREECAHGEILERFLREARVLSHLDHPNIVSLTDFGLTVPDGTPYLVLELLEGRMLEQVIDDGGPLELGRALAIVRQILSALAYAHHQGVIHRDLKSANLWLIEGPGRPEQVKVLDFGLAGLLSPDDEGQPGFTRRGYVYGSPDYLSPEQAAGEAADLRSDLYSTGVVLFEMIAGRLPFVSTDPGELISAHRLVPAPSLREVTPSIDIPDEVERIVSRALCKARVERWRDAPSFLAAVERAASSLQTSGCGPPRAARLPWWLWLAATAFAALPAAMAWALWR